VIGQAYIKLVTNGYLRPGEDALEVRVPVGGGDPGPSVGAIMALVPVVTSAFVEWQKMAPWRRVTWSNQPRVQGVFGNWYVVLRFRATRASA
jgi:hypothetical protein